MPPQQSPQTPPTSPLPTMENPHKGGAGPTAGIIIIVLLLIFGALYFWGARLNESHADAALPLIPNDPAAANLQ